MNYLLDANTFIEAKNRYYGMNICPGYWQWILDSNKQNQVASIELVKQELLAGNDELTEWANNFPYIFLELDDNETQQAFTHIAQHVMNIPELKDGATDEFLRGADPWLIAKAMTTGAVIVTHEQVNFDTKRKVLIPNVCSHFKIEWINTFELLERLEAQFVLPAA